MKIKELLEQSKAKNYESQLLRSGDDPSVWGTSSKFVDFAKKHSYRIENSPDFMYAVKDGKYYGFYDKYAGDGLLLDYKKHEGFTSRALCLDTLIDEG